MQSLCLRTWTSMIAQIQNQSRVGLHVPATYIIIYYRCAFLEIPQYAGQAIHLTTTLYIEVVTNVWWSFAKIIIT